MVLLSSSSSVNTGQTLANSMSPDFERQFPKNTSQLILQESDDPPDEYEKVNETDLPTTEKSTKMSQEEGSILQVVWRNVILYAYLHVTSLYGGYLTLTSAMWQTNFFAMYLNVLSTIGVTAGAHRLWSHRSYKARFPLRVLLAFFFTIALEDNIYAWARNHRVHHKHSETDADPHNTKRGFFFSHIGWVMCRKHPEVIKRGKQINLSDLLADPVVRFQRKFYLPLGVFCCFILPTLVPMYLWGETFENSLFVAALLRCCCVLHQSFFVNSVAHMWGNKPYDIHINPCENSLITLMTYGEGFHNYHHTFPYDYSSSEYGIKFNLTTLFIDVMAWFGLAYDRKIVSKSLVKARKLRTGEKSNNASNSCGRSMEFFT